MGITCYVGSHGVTCHASECALLSPVVRPVLNVAGGVEG